MKESDREKRPWYNLKFQKVSVFPAEEAVSPSGGTLAQGAYHVPCPNPALKRMGDGFGRGEAFE